MYTNEVSFEREKEKQAKIFMQPKIAFFCAAALNENKNRRRMKLRKHEKQEIGEKKNEISAPFKCIRSNALIKFSPAFAPAAKREDKLKNGML
jgi:hypothetical protein